MNEADIEQIKGWLAIAMPVINARREKERARRREYRKRKQAELKAAQAQQAAQERKDTKPGQ